MNLNLFLNSKFGRQKNKFGRQKAYLATFDASFSLNFSPVAKRTRTFVAIWSTIVNSRKVFAGWVVTKTTVYGVSVHITF